MRYTNQQLLSLFKPAEAVPAQLRQLNSVAIVSSPLLPISMSPMTDEEQVRLRLRRTRRRAL